MVSTYHFVCVSTLLMIACKTTVSFDRSNLTIEPKSPICLRQNVTLSCILLSPVNCTKSFANWSLLWYHNGLQLTNTTIIHHANYSITSKFMGKEPGSFTCVVREPISLHIYANLSVSVGRRPNPITSLIATPKFISDKDGFRYVMFSWLRQSSEFVYSLSYKIDLLGCFSSPCVEENIEPICNGTKCTALIDTEGHDLSDLVFYIVTRQRACETRSNVWIYNLTLSSCESLPPKTLFYIPFPPTKLKIETSYRRIIVRWQDILTWLPPKVTLTYKCPKTNATVTYNKPDIRIIYLSDKNIRGYTPYEKCTFCLAVQEYHCGQFSEPLCKTTRLREEPPSEAPKITCTNDTCPTSYDDQFRNLTVIWELPAEKYWGGVLREIRLRYSVTASNSTWEEIVLRNISRSSMVVERLNKTLDYTIYLQACNRVGCSGYSNQLQVYGARARPKYLTKSNSSNSNNVRYLIIGCLGAGFILVVVVAFIVIRSKSHFRQRKQSSSGLDSIAETDIPHYDEIDNDKEYNQLDKDDECDQLYNEDDSCCDKTRPV